MIESSITHVDKRKKLGNSQKNNSCERSICVSKTQFSTWIDAIMMSTPIHWQDCISCFLWNRKYSPPTQWYDIVDINKNRKSFIIPWKSQRVQFCVSSIFQGLRACFMNMSCIVGVGLPLYDFVNFGVYEICKAVRAMRAENWQPCTCPHVLLGSLRWLYHRPL